MESLIDEHGHIFDPSDFKLYQTLSQSDFNNINDLLFGTIIITDYEHQELYAFIGNLWEQHDTHVVR